MSGNSLWRSLIAKNKIFKPSLYVDNLLEEFFLELGQVVERVGARLAVDRRDGAVAHARREIAAVARAGRPASKRRRGGRLVRRCAADRAAGR